MTKILKYGPYSPSRLETGTCGYAFYRQYVINEKTKSIENLPQARGSVVHEVFEQITAKVIRNPDHIFSPTEVRGLVVDAVHRHPSAYQELDGIARMASLYINSLPKGINSSSDIELKFGIKFELDSENRPREYLDEKTFPGRPVMRPILVECDYDDPEAVARGRADIFTVNGETNTAIIHDHKTQPNIEGADTFQMGFYAWVASKIYPYLTEIHTILHFARFGLYSAPVTWNAESLYAIEDEVLTRISILESKQTWDVTPHKNCQYCPFLMECPHQAKFIEMDEAGGFRVKQNSFKTFGDVSKAVQLAGFINVCEECVKRAKDGLRDHVKQSGAIAIPGKIYDFQADESIDYDKIDREAFVELCKKYNVNPVRYMGLSSHISKNIWLHDNEAYKMECAALFPRKISSEFKGRKA